MMPRRRYSGSVRTLPKIQALQKVAGVITTSLVLLYEKQRLEEEDLINLLAAFVYLLRRFDLTLDNVSQMWEVAEQTEQKER